MNPTEPSHAERSASESTSPNSLTGSFVPMAAMLIRNANESDFNTRSTEFLSRVDPDDFFGLLLAELIIAAVIRLRRAASEEPTEGIPDAAWCRYHSLAERNFRIACKDYSRHLEANTRALKQASAPPAGPARRRMTKAEQAAADKAEAEAARPSPPPRPESTPEEIADAFTHWRKYVALVPKLSVAYPVILRTGRQVEDVSAWLDAGHSEEMMMRWYPELSRADIAACNGCDAEGMCGPFDPGLDPYPDTLPILDDLPGERTDDP